MGNIRLSVINQMLKDLDQRQAEQAPEQSSHTVPVVANNSSKQMILVALVIIVLLNIIGLFFWQLYNENQSLKAVQKANARPVNTFKPQIKAATVAIQSIKAEPFETKIVEKSLAEAKPVEINNNKAELILPKVDVISVEPIKTAPQAIVKANKQKKIPVPVSGLIEEQQVIANNVKTNDLNNQTQPEPNSQPSLTISRREMSPKDLAKQKFSRAEQAILGNNINKAEQLLEEILLLEPEHKPARKQLAALWFGRKSFQPALNLLSQGIAFSPQDSEYRLMQARIYLNQGQKSSALQILMVLADSSNVEYQALLANTAQQQGQFPQAITAYQQLVKLQENKGRWWLGLAIAFDSNSQFIKAEQAYQMAINQQNLSASAAGFARKRLTELGE